MDEIDGIMLMATGWTQSELNQLLARMDEVSPPLPSKLDKIEAARVLAVRASLSDRGALLNVETKGGGTHLYWLNVCVAKDLAGAISILSETYGWSRRRPSFASSDHLKKPELEDTNTAADTHSISTYGEPAGIVVRFAVGAPISHRTLYLDHSIALETMLCLGSGGTRAGWWGDDFELIPAHESFN